MKRRRILSLLLVLFMLTGMVTQALATTAAAGTGVPAHTHQWTSTDGDMVEWWNGGPTCTKGDHYMVWCTICEQYNVWTTKEGDAPPLGHDWGPWVVDEDSTCTQNGTRHRVCKRCAEIEREQLPLSAHDYKWTVTREATCAKEGERKGTCRVCGKSKTETTPKTAHTWGEWYILTEATPWSAGIREHKCKVCGATEQAQYYLPGTVLPGDRGDGVKYLQELLNAAGYDCGKADGINGNKTQGAIKQAESASGHEATGIGWTGLISWLEGVTGGIVVKPKDGPELTLTVTQVSEDDAVYVEDQEITFHLTLTNTGNVTFGSTTIYRMGHNSEAGYGTPQAALENGATEPLTVFELDEDYLITEEDVSRGYAEVSWVAQGFISPGNICTSETVTFLLPVQGLIEPVQAPIADVDLSIYVADEKTAYQKGDTLEIELTLTNIGNTTLSHVEILEQGENNTTGGEDYSVAYVWNNAAPGESVTVTVYYTVDDDDFARGMFDLSWEAVGRDEFDTPVDTGMITWIYEVEKDIDAAILVGFNGSEGVLAPGESLKVTFEITNIGKDPLDVFMYESEDGYGEAKLPGEGFLVWYYSDAPADEHNLQPGESYMVDYWITATMLEITAGHLSRTFTATAEPVGARGRLIKDACTVEFPISAAGGAPALTLTGSVTEGAKDSYAAGDEVTVTLTVTNTGNEPLAGVAVLAVGDNNNPEDPEEGAQIVDEYVPEAGEDEDIGDMGFLNPGESFTCTQTVILTEEMAQKGMAELGWLAQGWYVTGSEGEQLIDSNTVLIKLPVGEGAPSVELEAVSVGSVLYGCLDEAVPCTLKVTNVGSTPLWITEINAVDPDDNQVSGESADGPYGGTGGILLKPGEYVYFDYTMVLTQSDINADVLWRQATVIANQTLVSEDGYVILEPYCEGHEYLEVPFPERGYDVKDPVGLVASVENTDGWAFGLGDTVKLRYTITNTGSVSMRVGGYAFAYEDMTPAPVDGHTIPEESKCLAPGNGFLFVIETHVTEKDIEAGAIVRAFTANGHEVGDVDNDCQSNLVGVRIALKDTFDMSGSALVVTPEDTSSWVYSKGDTVDVHFLVENKGKETLNISGYSWEYPDHTYCNEDTFGDMIPDLAPGDSFVFVMHVTVNDRDVASGYVGRILTLGAHSYEQPDEFVGSNEAYIEFEVVDSHGDVDESVIEAPLIPPVFIEAEGPKLVLSVTQVSAPQANYEPGDEITFNWTLTNIGDMPCAFGGIEYYTDPGHMIGSERQLVDMDKSYILDPFGGSRSGTDTIVLDKLMNYDGMAYAFFEGDGLDPYTFEYVAFSNQVPFQFPMDEEGYTGWVIPPDTDYTNVTVEKAVVSKPLYIEGYQEGEVIRYEVTVTNTGEVTLAEVEVYDPLKGKNEDGILDILYNFKPGDSVTLHFSCTVTWEDVLRGYVENTATASWIDGATQDRIFSYSGTVVVPVIPENPDPLAGDLIAYKTWYAPAYTHVREDGSGYFVPGDKVVFVIWLSNTLDKPFRNLVVVDSLEPGDKAIAYLPELAGQDSIGVFYNYEITPLDAMFGQVVNTALIFAEDPTGETYVFPTNPARVFADFEHPNPPTPGKTEEDPPKTPFGIVTDVVVTKKEVSKPANGEYYTEGEFIRYAITVKNCGEGPVTNVTVMDSLGGIHNSKVGVAPVLNPGESRVFWFNYRVTAADVARGYVVNMASAYFNVDEYYTDVSNSNEVRSDTDGQPDDDGREDKLIPPVRLEGEGEGYLPCSLTLTARGEGAAEYLRHTCTVHYPVAQQAQALLAQAATPEARVEAYRAIRDLWQEQVDALYEAILAAAPMGQAKITVLNERMLFYAQLSVHEEALRLLFPGDEEAVAMRIAGLMEEKCSTLCYEAHTAPAERADSVMGEFQALAAVSGNPACEVTVLEDAGADKRLRLTLCDSQAAAEQGAYEQLMRASTPEELILAWRRAQKSWEVQLNADTNARYRAADKESRAIIAADRMTFDNWLGQRKALLELLYPEGAASEEVLTEEIARRMIGLCQAQHPIS